MKSIRHLYVIAIHSYRVDESYNGECLKTGHNRIESPAEANRFCTEWKETPDWKVGETVELISYRPLGEGWYGGHTYRKVGVVIHHYVLCEVIVFPDMPEPSLFKDLDEESKRNHNESLQEMVERGSSIEGHEWL